ncbi:MSMEG_0565 family glycosyltransferase [Paenibacillus sepulcri]|uniref:MSMEG_0565 family glycosyltransferase n=1 Tax=Paenibacillus sepulcri TaxID=359917 RepID=A0ABS7CBS8_9BACL|nr:MSMEG_0565 family glycosyltransferase [Paenibacillus sepulcri]
MKIALYTYNTKPRGGVVHTLALAEAMNRRGCQVKVFALGLGGTSGFYRPIEAEERVIPFSARAGETFESRVIRYIETYTAGLEAEPLEQFDIHHVQDCISANSLSRLKEKGRVPFFIRTVHHLDDFTTPALVDCQQKSVIRPEALITVSDYWRKRLSDDIGRNSTVIHNGVDHRFFKPCDDKRELKKKYGLADKTVYFTLGGIEPRKNTIRTLRAFAEVKRSIPDAVLVIAGGTTLFDYRYYLDDFHQELNGLDKAVRDDIRIAGSPDTDTIQDYYQLADCFVQPSVKEGWGLAIMEAMAAGTPVVASTIEVFREFLIHEDHALLADPEDEGSIAASMTRIVKDRGLSYKLSRNGKEAAKAYSWESAADQHLALYERMVQNGRAGAAD